mgnify:CR=1 FL=1
MTTPVLNTVLVRCSNTYQDELTVGDTKLLLDTSFRPEWHRKIAAEVVAVPRKLDTRHYAYRGLELGEIEAGDTIYFHYFGLMDENRVSKDQPALEVKPGDSVVFSKNADFINTIEDKEYFVMQQEDLLATQPQKANEIESDYAGPRHYYETSPFYLSPDHD